MKWIVGFLFVAIAGLSVYLYRQHISMRDQQSRIARLETIIDSKQSLTSASLDYQQKCAIQASAFFREQSGYKSSDDATYENHYSSKLNKCFVKIDGMDGKSARPNLVHSVAVMDAFEGKTYGEFIWESDQNKKYWDVPPLECSVVLINGEDRHCKSQDEFKELIRGYMED